MTFKWRNPFSKKTGAREPLLFAQQQGSLVPFISDILPKLELELQQAQQEFDRQSQAHTRFNQTWKPFLLRNWLNPDANEDRHWVNKAKHMLDLSDHGDKLMKIIEALLKLKVPVIQLKTDLHTLHDMVSQKSSTSRYTIGLDDDEEDVDFKGQVEDLKARTQTLIKEIDEKVKKMEGFIRIVLDPVIDNFCSEGLQNDKDDAPASSVTSSQSNTPKPG